MIFTVQHEALNPNKATLMEESWRISLWDTAALALVLLVALKIVKEYKRPSLNVPGIGYGSLPILQSWRGAIGFSLHPKEYLREGYRKYKHSYFRVSTVHDEFVMISEQDKIAEFIAAPEDILSFRDLGDAEIQHTHTMGITDGWHLNLLRTKLPRALPSRIRAALGEIDNWLDTSIGSLNGPREILAYSIMIKGVAQVSNFLFIGSDLCRDQKWLDLLLVYPRDLFISAEMIRHFPEWLKPLLVYMTPIHRQNQRAKEILKPVFARRLQAHKSGSGKFDDFTEWMLDIAPEKDKHINDFAEKMMILNTAAIHGTSMTLMAAIYALGREWDKYGPELRDEINRNMEDGQITFATLGKLVKMESFMRESARLNNVLLIGLIRHARKDFRFSDGTVIPAGVNIGVPGSAIQEDPEYYANGDAFDGFRFSRLSSDDGQAKGYPFIKTNYDYLPFGHGKGACPGRFFAVHEMKLVFARLLQRYDITAPIGSGPERYYFGKIAIPNYSLKLIFKNATIS